MNAAPLASGAASHPGFIGLDVLSGRAPDPVLIGPHHAGSELVEYLEGGLVARQSELPLELNSRDARRLAGNQVGRPEPYGERRVRALHDGSGGEVAIALAVAASKNGGAVGESVGITRRSAIDTNEAITPSGALKVSRACRFIWKQALKLGQRTRKRQVVPFEYVDSHDRPALMRMADILPIVSLGVNRISTVSSIRLPFNDIGVTMNSTCRCEIGDALC